MALIVVSSRDGDRDDAAAPSSPTAPDRDGDVRQEDPGSFGPGEAIPVTLQEGDVSFLLTTIGEDPDEPLTVTRVTDPDGEVIYQADAELTNASGGLTQAVRGGFQAGEVSIIAPAHPGFDVRPGTYAILVDNVAPVEASVLIKSGDVGPDVRQAIDLNIWLLSGDHDQATLEEGLRSGMDRVLESRNLVVGDISFSTPTPADTDSFAVVDAEAQPGEICEAMARTLGAERAVNLALIESFLDSSRGLASGLPGAPQHAEARASCVTAATRADEELITLDVLASTIMHEGSHFMGLTHTTEEDGAFFDDFADTLECDIGTYDGRDNLGYPGELDDLVSATECGTEGAGENYMFFEDSPPDVRDVLSQTVMTEDQAWALRRHPLFYPVG